MGSRFAATNYDETGRCFGSRFGSPTSHYRIQIARRRPENLFVAEVDNLAPIDTRADAADGSASGAPQISGNFHPASSYRRM
jgi:hypothetical protein